MNESNVVALQNPAGVADPLRELLRRGAQQLIEQAVEQELVEFLARQADGQEVSGRAAVVRNG